MADLLQQLQKVVMQVINDKLNIKYIVAEVTSERPLKFKLDDRKIILEKQVIFTESATPTSLTLQLEEMTPKRIAFTGCRGHLANTDGIGTSQDFVIETVKTTKKVYITRPLKVGDKVVLQKLNKQYLFIGRECNPHQEVELKEETL